MRHTLRAIIVATTSILASSAEAREAPSTAALPAVVAADYSVQKVGGGVLTFLGRPIYDASLWTTDGRFEGYEPNRPVVLSLWYERAFSRDDLLGITATAWRRLDAVPEEQRESWLDQLRGIWSDVAPGDNMTTVVLAGSGTRFYDARGFVGRVDDPAFGPAFFAIWLDDRSVLRGLRIRLLGADPAFARR